jgi:hypothetical protein
LTGKPAFTGDTEEEIMQLVARTAPLPPTHLVPQLALDLETICLKCLAKHPSQRYQSAAALADDLERFLAGQDVLARQLTRPQRVGRWISRNRLATGLAALCCLLFGGLVEMSVLYRQAKASSQLNMNYEQAQGRFARIREQVNRIAADKETSGNLLYDLAATLAAAAAAAETPEAADNYAGLAMELLRKARKKGYFDEADRIQQLKTAAVFENLRGRDDFKQLVRELDKP